MQMDSSEEESDNEVNFNSSQEKQDSIASENEVNFDMFRKEHETSNEHWNLKKNFIIHHWDTYESEALILRDAQLFINIELLGCKYADEIMQKIAQLSKEVPVIREYRKRRRNTIKRTFVSASDSAKSKVNPNENARLNVPTEPIKVKKQKTIHEVSTTTTAFNKFFHPCNGWQLEEQKVFNEQTEVKQNLVTLSESQRISNLRALLKDVILFDNGDDDANWTLNKTSACMRKIGKLELKFDQPAETFFYFFNDQIIAEGKGDSKKLAKKAADENLISTLKANCYTIVSKMQYFTAESVVQRQGNSPSVTPQTDQLKEDNLGFKMLKSLGWKGGSLGTGNGIIDPINLEIKIGRLGLGCDTDDFDIKYFRNLLQNFRKNQVEYDLVFSPEFSKDERAQIHQIAGQLNLKTKSYGKNSSRHLVISSKISPQILRQKLIEGDPYLLEKYEIIPPPFHKKIRQQKYQ